MMSGLTVRSALISEYDDEIALTRRVLERLPDMGLEWRPHEKSMSLDGLATHLAQIPHWGSAILARDGYDLELDHSERATALPSRGAVLDVFDRHAAETRRQLVGRTDAELAAPWSLSSDGHLIMSLPRASAVRRFVLNHLVHHRGQLTVYLRMRNVPLPPLYGPTADEGM
jgi:uncharacterized damage-inducible protein DinB